MQAEELLVLPRNKRTGVIDGLIEHLRCQWLKFRGEKWVECGKSATHINRKTNSPLCEEHASDLIPSHVELQKLPTKKAA